MSADLTLAKLKNHNLLDRIELLERQLATTNAAVAKASAGTPPAGANFADGVSTATPTEREFDSDTMTLNEKQASLHGIKYAGMTTRRV